MADQETETARAGSILSSLYENPNAYDESISGIQAQQKTLLDKLLEEKADSPQEAIGRVLAAAIPVGIAAVTGGSRGAGFAAGGAVSAIRNDEKRAKERQASDDAKAKLEFEVLGQQLSPLIKAKAEARKGNRQLALKEAEPLLALEKEIYLQPLKLAQRAAGRSVTNVNVNPNDTGPALSDEEVEALTAGQAPARFQAQEIRKATGKNPTMTMLNAIVKNTKVTPKTSMELEQTPVTISRLKNIKTTYDQIKERPALEREILSRLPEFVAAGAPEKFLNSQVGALALQIAADVNGGRPTDKDQELVNKLFARAGTDEVLGSAKLESLILIQEMMAKRKYASIGAGPKVTPEEEAQFNAALTKVTQGTDPIAQAFRVGKKNSPVGAALAKNFTNIKTGKTLTREQLKKRYTDAQIMQLTANGELDAAD